MTYNVYKHYTHYEIIKKTKPSRVDTGYVYIIILYICTYVQCTMYTVLIQNTDTVVQYVNTTVCSRCVSMYA